MTTSEIIEYRLDICRKCPLYKEDFMGEVCNPKKFINKEGDSSYIPRSGYTRGCGCILRKKAAVPSNHCIVGKW